MPALPVIRPLVRGFQWDLARQVERLDWLIAQLPRYAEWGYQELYLHLEDSVDYPSLPGIARKDAYGYRELAQLVWAATRVGIGVVPIVNLLGHTQYLIKVPELRDLNEYRADDGSPLPVGQVCPLHPRMLEVAEKLMQDMAPFCTAGKVHVGLDESYHLGRHPLSRREIARVGMEGHFARYVGRLNTLAQNFGLRLGLWADMLALLPATIRQLPPGIIAYDWYYYPFKRRPRIELRNFADYDLAAPLRARGIEYWGCPMNGAFRHEPLPIVGERLATIVAWWRRCKSAGAGGCLVTSWEASRLSAELPMTVDAAAAGLWLDGEEDVGRLLAAGARRMYGRNGYKAARALLAADRHPFSGYVRWQINDRWNTVLSEEPMHPWRAESAACRRAAGASGLPSAIEASLRFRAYLAERDVFVRDAGRGVWRMRRAVARGDEGAARRLLSGLDQTAVRFGSRLSAARGAARSMWRRTRNAKQSGPNEILVGNDAERLRHWRSWLRRCGKRLDTVWEASPVAGAWQMLFTVENFEPASQKVAVEQLTPGGIWEDVYGLFLIEFRARAARPRASLRYCLSVPIEWTGAPSPLPRLRIAARGFGRFKIGTVFLTDGVERYEARSRNPKSAIVGRATSRSGFPNFDWKKNRAVWEPTWLLTRPL